MNKIIAGGEFRPEHSSPTGTQEGKSYSKTGTVTKVW